MTDETAGRVAPRRTPSEIIAALLAELRPWAWRARAAMHDPGATQAVDRSDPWGQAQLVPVLSDRPLPPRRSPGSR